METILLQGVEVEQCQEEGRPCRTQTDAPSGNTVAVYQLLILLVIKVLIKPLLTLLTRVALIGEKARLQL